MSVFIDSLVKRLEPLGHVHARAMFGGHGIFKDDLMFALVADEVVYFKVDADSQDIFAKTGGEAFVYVKNGTPMTMSYWRVPEPCPPDDADLLRWAHVAHQAAQRQKHKRQRQPKPPKL